MKHYQDCPHVKEADARVQRELGNIVEAEDRLVALSKESAEANKSALEVEARASIGDLSEKEAAAATEKAKAFEAKFDGVARSIERGELAVNMLRSKKKLAENSARDAIEAELRQQHSSAMLTLVSAVSDAQVALEAVGEIEECFEPNKIRRPIFRTGKADEIALTFAGSMSIRARPFLKKAAEHGVKPAK